MNYLYIAILRSGNATRSRSNTFELNHRMAPTDKEYIIARIREESMCKREDIMEVFIIRNGNTGPEMIAHLLTEDIQ